MVELLDIQSVIFFATGLLVITVLLWDELKDRLYINFCFAASICLIISITLLPINFDTGRTTGRVNINLIPFKQIVFMVKRYRNRENMLLPMINMIGNILLFVPFGYSASGIIRAKSKIKIVFILGVLLSISIECMQLLEMLLNVSAYRVFDIDDILLNSFGTYLGHVINIYKQVIYDKGEKKNEKN